MISNETKKLLQKEIKRIESFRKNVILLSLSPMSVIALIATTHCNLFYEIPRIGIDPVISVPTIWFCTLIITIIPPCIVIGKRRSDVINLSIYRDLLK